jgi:methylase of polypeptide subunit release factors
MLLPTQGRLMECIEWQEGEQTHRARWLSEGGMPPPKRVVVGDDSLNADTAYRWACEGTAILWCGDFQNARQLLQAMGRRLDRKPHRVAKTQPAPSRTLTEAFHLHRQSQAQRARILGMLLVPLDADYKIPLRRAPEVQQACMEALGELDQNAVMSLRGLQGLIGAHEWRKKGVPINALQTHITPHYGVFSPIRGEYVDLVAQAPLPSQELAFDIGTGTGVLAAVLAKRGVQQIVATDQDVRALSCARENMARLGYADQVEVVQADLFPPGHAPLIVCNPPWLPGKPSAALEYAIYDPESRMLKAFLQGLAEHLSAGGEGWLILSDLAEHLGLRPRETLLDWIAAAGLQVIGKLDTRPHHPKTMDQTDPLYPARAAEVTSLWRLAKQ